MKRPLKVSPQSLRELEALVRESLRDLADRPAKIIDYDRRIAARARYHYEKDRVQTDRPIVPSPEVKLRVKVYIARQNGRKRRKPLQRK